MKRIFAFLGLVVVFLAIIPTWAASACVKDSTKTISVTVPSGWKENKSGLMGAKLILVGPIRSRFATNINLATEDVGSMSLVDYAKISERNLPKVMSSCRIISRVTTKLAGIPARELVYTAAVGTHKTHLKFRCIFAINKKTAYILTFTAPAAYYSKDVQSFNSAIKSLKWLK